MRFPSPALAATLRALHGEPDVHVVAPALSDQQFARILALVPGVDPVISALGALAGELPDALPPHIPESPALSAAITSLIGTNAGKRVLTTWLEIAPAEWGTAHADMLIDAVHHNRCEPWVAASLIVPCDASAALLHKSSEIAVAIRRWGQATPDDPTAWMDALTPTERDRFLDALRHAPNTTARCLPWLPEELATPSAERIDASFLSYALNAYAIASPVARDRHATVLAALIQRAGWAVLDVLTHLAVASRMDDVWLAVVNLLRETPNNADQVVAAAPWDALHADVQTTMLSAADHNDVCAAIAFARGMRGDAPQIAQKTARAFFATVTPTVWNTLPTEIQWTWYDSLRMLDTHLAVRSLGLDPAFLACAKLNDSLVTAVRRHLRDDAAVQRTLLPVAVRALLPAAISDVVAALPMPLDPVAFVQIASGIQEMPLALRDWITAHPTPHACRTAVTALHIALRSIATPVAARCTALAEAFTGWSSEEATALLAALPDTARDVLRPDPEVLADALVHPDRRDAFRQALDAIDSLPPAATRPALFALGMLASAFNPDLRGQARSALAQALRDHGDCFLALVDALADEQRIEILPLPRSAPHAAEVHAIAAADPLAAYRLAHALQSRSPTAMLDALTDAPVDALTRIWGILPKDLQQSVPGDRDTLLHGVAAPERANDLAFVLRAWNVDDPPVLLALRMLIDDDARRQERGVAILAQQPDLASALLPLFRDDLRTTLASNPAIAIASADLPPLRSPTPAPMRRRRR